LDSETDVHRNGSCGSIFTSGGAFSALSLIYQILKGGAAGFEARGVGICDIVRDNVNVCLLREHAGRGGSKGFHVFSFLKSGATKALKC
jgi:hypothetical protein